MHNLITVCRMGGGFEAVQRLTRTAVREWVCANTSAARCQPLPLGEVSRVSVTERVALSPDFVGSSPGGSLWESANNAAHRLVCGNSMFLQGALPP